MRDKRNNRISNIRYNNSGSALIVCIIVLLFVSILATVILYMSGINYRMKKSEYNNRLTFYESEIPLESIEANLVLPLSEAFNNAYRKTNSRFLHLGTSDARRRDFYQNVYDELESILLDNYSGASIGDAASTATDSTPIKNIIHNLTYDNIAYDNGIDVANITCNESTDDYRGIPYSYITLLSDPTGLNMFTADGIYIVLPANLDKGNAKDNYESFVERSWLSNPTDSSSALNDVDKCRILFKDVCVVSVKDGYRSIVTTDIAIQFPPMNWDHGSTNGYEAWDVYQLIYYVNWQKY